MANLSVLDATPATQAIASLPDSDGSFILIRSSEHRKATFRYAGNFTPVAAATDALIIQGSATRTLRIKHIMLGGVATTAGLLQTTLVRRSAANSGGTAVLSPYTAARMDINDAAPTGVVSSVGTGNFGSLGSSSGNVGFARLWLPTATGAPSPLTWTFATRQDKALILRGTSDFICVNFGGNTVPSGGSVDFEIEIEEDLS